MSAFTETYNIHTHSFYCGHGSGTIAEYVREAEDKGLQLLGFSEHCPFPDNFLHRSRMDYSMMESYERDVRAQQKEAGIQILLGYECDYFPRYEGYLRKLKESGRVDYLVTGTHFIERSDGTRVSPFSSILTLDELYRYRDQFIGALESGLFDYAAHPDLFMAGSSAWDEVHKSVAREIIGEAVRLSIPLEINGNGMLKRQAPDRFCYPFGPFWTLAAKMGASVILSTDAHSTANLTLTKARLEVFAHQHGVTLVRPCVSADGQLKWSGAGE